MENKDIKPVKRLIEAGSNMAGAAAGGAIGFLLGEAQGAAIGGATGAVIAGVVKVLGDISHRSLSSREEIRVGTAAFFAVEKIRERFEANERPRDDGFFQAREYNSRSDAEEIFEGVLLKSRDAHEEKKIKIIANIFASVAFYSDVSTSEANHILQDAENMTYRKMCLLALFERKAELKNISLATIDFSQPSDEDDKPVVNDLSVLQEIYQLYNLGLVACRDRDSKNTDDYSGSQIVINDNYIALLSLYNVAPEQMILTNLGKRYYSVMNLSEIPKEDLMEVALTLSK